MSQAKRPTISRAAEQTFQIVSLVATVFVVAIHYRSASPQAANVLDATWNELAQEFLLGGMARVAVPMFAFASGFFYFRSYDGSFLSYRRKLVQRGRTLWFPFFMVSSIAMSVWLVVRRLEANPIEMSWLEFLSRWLLQPPAEQLWYLRDLIVLVSISPVIRWQSTGSLRRASTFMTLGLLWLSNVQPFPMVVGWRLLHIETLFFFTLGCFAVDRVSWFQASDRITCRGIILCWLGWCSLVSLRVYVRPNFDIWYASHFDSMSLVTHQSSILVGVCTLWMTCWRLRYPRLLQWSGASFFVYLIHEFPLRAIVKRTSDRWLDPDASVWIVAPLVVVGCYVLAFAINRTLPGVMSLVTGGRMPEPAQDTSITAIPARLA